MPHLSPMNWVMTPIMMVLIMIALMVIMWWQFTPRFPIFSASPLSSSLSSYWHWW